MNCLFQTVSKFNENKDMGSNVVFQTATNMTFPNLTVCHTRYFDKARMAGIVLVTCTRFFTLHTLPNILAYGVNDTLASYMTSILDSGYLKQYRSYESSTSIGEMYVMGQNDSEHQLNRILHANNFTLLELFEALAVR